MFETTINKSIAVIIGINEYGNGISNLSTAINDAKEIAHILKSEHAYEVQLIRDSEAILSNLKTLLEGLKDTIGESDRLLFYFAGHGIALDGDDGPAGYLIPQNADPSDRNTFLPMQDLHECLGQLKCRHCLVILDCCFGGAFRWSSTRDIAADVPQKIHKERFDRFMRDPAWQVITSAAYDQKALDILALEDDRGQTGEHSPFAAAVMQALQGAADAFPPAENGKPAGDGVITATELYQYVRDRVEVATQTRQKRQTPGLWPLPKHDKGEYIFFTPGHELNLPPAPELRKENNPYRGLESFEEEHSELYFGREKWVQKLAEEVISSHALTIVLGASGTGKSSLVKAGLLPYLRRSEAHQFCILEPMRPGETPLTALAQVCVPLMNEADGDRAKINSLSQRFHTDTEALASIVETWSKVHPQTKVLLVVDQFEELITQCHSDVEKDQFQCLIQTAISAHSNQLHVVITLRLDFEAQFQAAALKSDWMQSRFVVPPMTQDELREVIEKPASARVLYFEPYGLVDRLINEVVQMPGALPLLSFTLSELYLHYLENQNYNRALTESDYDDLGGVVGSLTQRATQEYDELCDEDLAYAKSVRRIMLRMVAVEGGETARRRVPRSELFYSDAEENKRVAEVIRCYSEARLIVEGKLDHPQSSIVMESDSFVEPAHDALVRSWDKLLQWKKEEQENLLLQQRLTQANKAWDETGRRNRDLWNNNSRLGQLEEALKSDNNWLNKLETEFVQRSRNRRRNLQLRVISAGLTVIAILSGVTAWALQNASTASQNEAIAQANKQEAEKQASIAKKNEKIANREKSRAEKEARKAIVEAQRANREAKRATEKEELAEARRKEAEESRNAEVVQRKIADKQKSLALQRQKEAEESRNAEVKQRKIAERQRTLAIKRQREAEYQANVARVRGQSARALNWISTVNVIPALVLAIEAMDKGKWIEEVELTAQSSLLHALQVVQETNLLQGHQGEVLSVAFSPDGQRIVSGSVDNTLRLWDVYTGQPIGDPLRHTISVGSVVFSPDGQHIASSDGGTIRLWDAQTGRPIGQPLKGHRDLINAIAFSPNGRYIASAGLDKTIRLWNVQTHQAVREPIKGHQQGIKTIAFSPNGQRIVSGSYGGEEKDTLRFWDAETGQPIGNPVKGHFINALTFSPDGQRIAITSSPYEVKFVDAQTGQLIGKPLIGHRDLINAIAFSPDGHLIATSSRDNTIRLWDAKNSQPIGKPLRGHLNFVLSARFSPDSQRIVSGSSDNTVRIWDIQTQPIGERIKWYRFNDTYPVSISSDGRRIISIDDDSTLWIWDAQTGTPIGQPLKGYQDGVESVVFSPNMSRIAVISSDDNQTLHLWDTRSGKPIGGPITHPSEMHSGIDVQSATFSPDGLRLASGGNGNVRFWEARTGKPIGKILEHNPGDTILAVAFSPDGNRLVSGDYEGIIRLWNVSTGQLLNEVEGHKEEVRSLSFSPDGKHFISGSNDTMIRLWNAYTGQPISGPLQGHRDWVNSVAFSPDGRRIVSGGDDKTIRLWDTSTGQPIGQPFQSHDGIGTVMFSQDNRNIVSINNRGIIQLWAASSEVLLRLACNRIKHHPFLNKPESVTSDTELLGIAKRVKVICQKRA